MISALEKVAAALDLMADELDTTPVAAAQPEASSPKTASTAQAFSDFYRQQVGEEAPASLVEKLSATDDAEVTDAMAKLMKSASHQSPTPMGGPSDDNDRGLTSKTGGAQDAWEAFADDLSND